MSRSGLEKFLYRFDKEPALLAEWRAGSGKAFVGFDLDADELRVLAEGDLATLYQWGVHPLLIRNFSGTIGIRYIDAYAERGLKP